MYNWQSTCMFNVRVYVYNVYWSYLWKQLTCKIQASPVLNVNTHQISLGFPFISANYPNHHHHHHHQKLNSNQSLSTIWKMSHSIVSSAEHWTELNSTERTLTLRAWMSLNGLEDEKGMSEMLGGWNWEMLANEYYE